MRLRRETHLRGLASTIFASAPTELLRAGVHVKIVAEHLGDTEATVLRTSHVLPDMQESAAAAIEPMLRGLLVT